MGLRGGLKGAGRDFKGAGPRASGAGFKDRREGGFTPGGFKRKDKPSATRADIDKYGAHFGDDELLFEVEDIIDGIDREMIAS